MLMKSLNRILLGGLFLLAGLPVSLAAQGHPEPEHGKPEHHQPEHRQEGEHRSPPAAHTRHATPARRTLEVHDQREVWEHQRAHDWNAEHRTWQQRGGYHGVRIPAMRFRAYFGPHRWFRLYGAPMELVGPYPRFKYAGYWFRLMDPWPEAWAPLWFENDAVCIVYQGDGYYLIDQHHPDVLIAVEVYVS
jgi:hypothetical protein